MTGPGRGQDVFVGRLSELVALREAQGRAGARQACVVLLEGAPGIGKSALVRRFQDEAPPDAVLCASCDEGESALSMGVVRQLADGLAGDVRADAVEPPGGSAEKGTLASAEALALALGRRLRHAPLTIVVEDMQWADEDSAQALLYAVRRLRQERLLVLLTAQPGAPLPPGRERWLRLASDSRVGRQLTLGGLDVHAVGDMAAALGVTGLSEVGAQRLHRHTAGHPRHTRQFLEEVPIDPLLWAAGMMPAPPSLRSEIGRRLGQGSASMRALLEQMAVVGRVDGWEGDSDAVTEAMAAGLLVPAAVAPAGQARFPSPVFRAAVYELVPAGRRRELHAKAARNGPDALWHRARGATGPDDALAAELAAHARLAARSGDLDTAARRALAAAALTPDETARQTRWLAAIKILVDNGDPEQALRVRRDIEACEPSPMRDCLLASVALEHGRLDEAQRLLLQVSASDHPMVEGTMAAETSVRLAQIHLLRGEAEAAVDLAARACSVDDAYPAIRFEAAIVQLIGLLLAGRGPDAEARLASLAEAAAVSGSSGASQALAGYFAAATGDFEHAVGPLLAATSAAQGGEGGNVPALCYAYLAESLLHLGRLPEAAAAADRAISVGSRAGRRWTLTTAHAVRAQVCALRGEFAAAADHVRQGQAAAAVLADWSGSAQLAVARATAARAAERPADTLMALAPLADPAIRLRLDRLGRWHYRVLEAEALADLGRLDEAEAAVAGLAVAATRAGARVAALRVRGVVAAARGDAQAARALLADAQAAAPEAPQLEAALTDFARARLCMTAGERREAVRWLRQARSLFVRLGTAPFTARCDRHLVDLGVHRGSGDDPLDLTAQERAVARLAARGLSNPEISRQLFISRKTVETHLGRVFAKLGLHSRRELAGALGPEP